MAKHLVTGAAGFIGARTADLLLEEGHEVVGIDNMNSYYSVELKEHRRAALQRNPRFTYHYMDIEDVEALNRLFDQHAFSTVYHLAARAGVPYSVENPTIYMTTNAVGALNIMEQMIRKNVPKLVLASTSSLYAGQQMPFTEDLPVNEPISPYAASKKATEVMAYTYHHLYKLDVSILRYFTVYGPAGRPDMSPYRFIKWLDEGTPLTIYGNGTQSRDFTYVDDIARGTVLAQKKLGFEIINLGGGKNPYRINDMINILESIMIKKAVINYQSDQKGDMKSTCGDISKAKRLLNWEPKMRFEHGLEASVKWYLENKEWLERIPC